MDHLVSLFSTTLLHTLQIHSRGIIARRRANVFIHLQVPGVTFLNPYSHMYYTMLQELKSGLRSIKLKTY